MGRKLYHHPSSLHRAERTLAALVLVSVVALLLVGAIGGRPAAAQEGPVVSLGDTSGLERDAEFGSVMLPVTLSTPAVEPVVVSYYTVNDTAVYIPPEDRTDQALFGDYQRRGTPDIPRTISIPAGSTQTSINVSLNFDDEIEPEESFSIVISSVSGANASIGRSTGTATIIDADGVSTSSPAISVSSVSIVAGDDIQLRAQFFIHLSRATGSPLTVTYDTHDGTASSPADYVAKLPGSTTFSPGQISKTIDVLVNPSPAVSGRTFTLQITTGGGAPVEEIQTVGTAHIIDDGQVDPVEIKPAVSAGGSHTCALRSSGELRCWGSNALGQLGDGSTVDSLTPVSVSGLDEPVKAVVTGNAHTCALTISGSMWCWGDNLNGQLGDGTTVAKSAPTAVDGIPDEIVAIGAGDNHSCAALAGGGIKCWGWGTRGQLGQGQAVSSSQPVDVQGLTAGVEAVSVSAGYQHTCASFNNGSASCWGRNNLGQLGLGYSGTASMPSAVQPIGMGSGVSHLSAGGHHACAVQMDGLRCFGENGQGQLGIGTTELYVATPTLLSDSTSFVETSSGSTLTCGRSSAGAISCWGLNQEGQLGIGQPTVNHADTPQLLPLLTSGQISVDSGIQHACSMASDESVTCWGLNDYGQLGNGNTTRQFSPVSVIGLWPLAE